MKYKALLYDMAAQQRRTVEVEATGFRDARDKIRLKHGQEAVSVWTAVQVPCVEEALSAAERVPIRQCLMDIAAEAVRTVAAEADKAGVTIE